MNLAVDHQHGTGLGGKIRLEACFHEGFGFHHTGCIALDVENPIGLEMEIAAAAAPVDLPGLLAFLDIEANGFEVVVIHPRIHGEAERLAGGLESIAERGKIAIGLAIAIEIVEREMIRTRIETADGVIRALETHRLA